MKKQTINMLIVVALLVGMSGLISAADNISNATISTASNVSNVTISSSENLSNVTLYSAPNTTTNNNNISINASVNSNFSAGVLPGSFFYGLDKGFSNLRLALTFNREKKAQLALKIAQERLVEAQILAQRGEYNRSLQAEKAHERIMEKAKRAIMKMNPEGHMKMNQEGNANKTFSDLQKITRMQTRLENHLRLISQMRMQLLSQKGQNLTQEQLNQIDVLFSSMKNSSVNASLSAQQQKENLKVMYKALRNLTNSQLNQTIEKIDSEEGYNNALRKREKQDNQSFRTEMNVRLRNLKRLQLRLNESNITTQQKERLQKVIDLQKKNIEQFKRKKDLTEQRQKLIQNFKDNRSRLIAQMRENYKNTNASAGVGLNANLNSSGIQAKMNLKTQLKNNKKRH